MFVLSIHLFFCSVRFLVCGFCCTVDLLVSVSVSLIRRFCFVFSAPLCVPCGGALWNLSIDHLWAVLTSCYCQYGTPFVLSAWVNKTKQDIPRTAKKMSLSSRITFLSLFQLMFPCFHVHLNLYQWFYFYSYFNLYFCLYLHHLDPYLYFPDLHNLWIVCVYRGYMIFCGGGYVIGIRQHMLFHINLLLFRFLSFRSLCHLSFRSLCHLARSPNEFAACMRALVTLPRSLNRNPLSQPVCKRL